MNKLADKELVESQDKALIAKILDAIKGIEYGHIVITIHDSRVVQIDKTEKIRIRNLRECVCK